ncbi:MAG: hypothetical protein IJB70_00980 [Clostridia bacterium]|nr:hypothetical protein [Clostridia bacterium]
MGIASLILGICSIVFCWFPYLGLFLGIGGIILGAIGKKNGGVAQAGMIVSIIGTAITTISWIACVACALSL